MGTATSRTAAEAGWHLSRYNLTAPVPGTDRVAIANLYQGTCAAYGPLEQYALSALDELDERHPLVVRLAQRGVICDFDEHAALEAMGRAACARGGRVFLTICPTMGCNFACPYCFEDHVPGRMPTHVQDGVVALAERMADAARARVLHVTWFGGEPLLAPDVVESLSARLVALAEERGVRYEADVITNGYLLTEENCALLARARVARAQVTLDGVGAAHDATRMLVGGGPTFGRIVANLRRPGLPFSVRVRHNVHAGNRGQAGALRALVADIARESGNDVRYRAVAVQDNEASAHREGQVGLLRGSDAAAVALAGAAEAFEVGRGHHCGAHLLFDVGIDERGNLYKCWEAVGRPQLAFGHVDRWDLANPLATAEKADLLVRYLNTAGPVPDDDCTACVWLPVCQGGCPHRRLFGGGKRCVPYRDDPEGYVAALLAGGKIGGVDLG